LFYRLNVIPVEMPALRERVDDIPLIAEHFLAKYTREMDKAIDGFSPEVLAALRTYPWPGNVRELENMVERAVALESGRSIQFGTLPENLREGRPATSRSADQNDPVAETGNGFSLERHLQEVERSHLERALARAGGVQTHAADVLGLSFRQFRYLAKKHGIK
jgi:two-component system response regulator PilR (NtrC family)